MRLFIFFDQTGKPLFVRDDAETASWTVEEMSMVATFPYNPDKVIERGMRVGFEDSLNVLQPFEIRKIETIEPDHYQRITCEHIVISELTDCHMQDTELTNVTAQAALTGILAGTGWSVGNVTASGTSSGDLALGSVWQNVRTIEQNWNVYITPRVTFSNSGITGKYLDIAPAQGTWNGIYLSLDKNADEMGVVIDDTEVKTALYGYGAAEDSVPLTFENVAWQATSKHPAKPQGQKYIEDPDATAAYGRNGTARFGFYQNTDITDPNVLLQKTWEVLKTTNAPRVTVNCMVRDLYRLGYNDQPIRLHDIARVEIRDTNTKLELEIIQLVVDLLDPTATRPTIGAYIPNIVYIQRQTAMNAAGGAANTSSGRRGGGGSGGGTALDEKLKEFETQFLWNDYQIGLRAFQRDLDDESGKLLKAYAAIGISSDSIDEIVAGSGVMLDEDGNIITDAQGNPVFQQGADPMWTKVNQTAEEITQVAVKSGVNELGENETLFSRISQTADAIETEVERATESEGSMASSIKQNADSITAEVTNRKNADNTLDSRIQQTATDITLEVSRATAAEGNLKSSIKVNADNIELKVSKNGVISAINQTAESVTIEARRINFVGSTVANDIKAEQARLTNVITGRQNVTYMIGTAATFKNLAVTSSLEYRSFGELKDLIIASFGAAQESGGTITIPSTTLGGNAGPRISFSITDTATYKAAAVSRVSVSLSGTPGENSGHYYQSGSATLTKINGTTQNEPVSIIVDSAVEYGRGLMGVRVSGNTVQRYESSLASVTITTDASVHYNSRDHTYYAMSLAYANNSLMTGTEDTSPPSGTEAFDDGKTIGWNAAHDKVKTPDPSSDTHTTVFYPSSAYGNQSSIAFYVTGASNSDYAYITNSNGQITYAQVYTGAYTNGQTVGESNFTPVNNARYGLSRYSGGWTELFNYERGSYHSVGTHYWYYINSDGWDSLYRHL